METCFLALFFHNNKVFLTLDQCSLTLVNFILTLENLGPRVHTLVKTLLRDKLRESFDMSCSVSQTMQFLPTLLRRALTILPCFYFW